MSKRNEILPRVDGRDIPASFHLGRCEAERWVRQPGAGAGYDGNWARVRGCDLAFFFRLPAGGHNADVTCPGCGLSLDITTRQLRRGFLPLSDADVRAIKASKGWPVDVSCLAPLDAAPSAPVALPADAKRASQREAAEAALRAFDAKPRCRVCWGYNASAKKHDTCGFCREYGKSEADQISDGERDQYTWKRGDLVARVAKYGGVAGPAPVGQAAVDAHVAERQRKAAAYKAQRLAALRGR